jgi:hypothetical protein
MTNFVNEEINCLECYNYEKDVNTLVCASDNKLSVLSYGIKKETNFEL